MSANGTCTHGPDPLDGNKRTARACCVLFLKLNGIEPKDPPAEAGEAMVSLATGGWNEA